MQRELASYGTPEFSSAKAEMTISDVARLYGVSLRTLRFYEDKGLLHPRRQGTARFYSPHDRIRLELVLKGKRLGFTLAEIFELIASRSSRSASDENSDLTVSLDRGKIDAQIAHLVRQRDDLTVAIEELRAAHARMFEPVD